MENEERDGNKRRYELRKSILDYGMGVFISAIGIIVLFKPQLFIKNLVVDDFFRYMFGGLWLLYGVWRFYRGYKKNYYR